MSSLSASCHCEKDENQKESVETEELVERRFWAVTPETVCGLEYLVSSVWPLC